SDYSSRIPPVSPSPVGRYDTWQPLNNAQAKTDNWSIVSKYGGKASEHKLPPSSNSLRPKNGRRSPKVPSWKDGISKRQRRRGAPCQRLLTAISVKFCQAKVTPRSPCRHCTSPGGKHRLGIMSSLN